MDFWPTEIVVTGWRCADPYWRPRPDCCRSQSAVAATECQWRIDRQRPVTGWAGAGVLSGRVQVDTAVSDGYLRAGGLGFAHRRIGGHGLVCLVPGRAASLVIVEDRCPGCGVELLQAIWRAARPGREQRQLFPFWLFLTRMYLTRLFQFYHHPLRLGPAPHDPHGAVPAIGPPQAIVTIGSIPAILILASDSLTPSLVAAAACLPSA